MALAQRRPAQPFQRAIVLPRSRAQASGPANKSNLQLQASLAIGFVSVTCLVGYVYGCSRMTSANYKRCLIQQELNKLRVQEQSLSAQVTLLKNTDRIEEWARASGMVRASGVPVVIGPAEGN
jgi:hypothetical protein